jgi:hydrogenase nickel incorporation protein HypA/HybF
MHELSVCLSLMQQVEAIAEQQNAARVTRITLSIGPLSGVEPDLLQHAYPLATAGTVAEGAELIIETADVVVRCSQCQRESNVAANKLLCGSCGDFRTQVVSGDELTLLRVELDRPVESTGSHPRE